MHRCYIKPADWDGRELSLSPEEEHHLLDVLRARTGDTVAVFDGQGREVPARIVSCPRRAQSRLANRRAEGRRRIVLRVLTGTRTVKPALFRLTLIQALPKGRRMDLIVEKATELGVSTVIPVISERVTIRLGERQRKERAERWQRVALSAARQCGAGWVPEVRPVSGYKDAMAGCGSFDFFVAGSLDGNARPFHCVVDAEKSKRGKPRNIALLIGPEGDLTPAEIEIALDRGAIPVSFGPSVLRVETAALYGLSVLVYEFLAS